MASSRSQSDPALALFGQPWSEIEAAAADVVAAAWGRVARVEYASRNAQWEDPRAAWSERLRLRPVTKAMANCRSLDTCVEYGYDAEAEIVLARRYYDAERVESEHIWTAATDGAVVQLLYDSDLNGNRSLARLLVPIGGRRRTTGVDTYYDPRTPYAGVERERYTFCADGVRVCAILSEREDRNGVVSHSRSDVRHSGDSTEVLVVSESVADGASQVIYRRTAPPEMRTAARDLEARVVAAVEHYVADAVGPDRPSRVGLRYRFADPWTLVLGIGVEPLDERPETLQSCAESWDPARFAHYSGDPVPGLDDPAVAAARLVVEQEWRSTDDVDARRRFLVRCAKSVATQLTSLGNSAAAVYAYDDEGVDLERNVRQSVPKHVRRTFGLK